MQPRVNFFIAGESGMGIVSSGEILMHALASKGYWSTASREFPSLIKGGQAAFKVSFSNRRIRGGSDQFHLGVCMGKTGIKYGLDHLSSGSILVHDFARREDWKPDLKEQAAKQDITIIYVPTRDIIHDLGVHTLFENTIVLGAVAHILWIDHDTIVEALHHEYGAQKKLWKMNKTCIEEWYAMIDAPMIDTPDVTPHDREKMIVDGNTALALGAINAGVRAYYAYPMSPASSILTYFAKSADQTGVVVKQAEDEITAMQMNIGSMYAGARALTATSGGGLDLMSESISLAGMLEVPTVLVVAQRPWPATGLPTRTAQWDLNLAINAGHGEFARIVLAVSDQETAFELIQEAYDYAETWQVPVIVLSEKAIAENQQTIPTLQPNQAPIERNLVTDPDKLQELEQRDRYKITDSGVSTRRLPWSSTTTYFCNGDEHAEDGTIDESPESGKMIHKRIKKLDYIKQTLPDPIIYGKPNNAEISFIWRGSTKNAILDLIDEYREQGVTINYLHFDWLWPLRTEVLQEFIESNDHICVVENNATGQLAELIHKELCIRIPHKLLKRNGRPIVREDIHEYVKTHVPSFTPTNA